jgi:hypothetical protein
MKIREERVKKGATEDEEKKRLWRLWIVTNSSMEGEETDTILRERKYE